MGDEILEINGVPIVDQDQTEVQFLCVHVRLSWHKCLNTRGGVGGTNAYVYVHAMKLDILFYNF